MQCEPLIYVKNDPKILAEIQRSVFDKILDPTIGDRLEGLIEQLKFQSKNKAESYLVLIPDLINSERDDVLMSMKEVFGEIFEFFEKVTLNLDRPDWASVVDSESLVLMFIHEFLLHKQTSQAVKSYWDSAWDSFLE
jgi:hypothetical protein